MLLFFLKNSKQDKQSNEKTYYKNDKSIVHNYYINHYILED